MSNIKKKEQKERKIVQELKKLFHHAHAPIIRIKWAYKVIGHPHRISLKTF
jgi:SepF-like predicted cell division protein (DUF552 family)